jgi:lysophospholipase L1-like esterase
LKKSVFHGILIAAAFLLAVPLVYMIAVTFRPGPGQSAGANPYVYGKRSLFKILPVKNNAIIFLGDSLTDGCEWSELFGNPVIINRGINSETTSGVLEWIDDVSAKKPSSIFIMIGGNDILAGSSQAEVISNYSRIIDRIKNNSPSTKIFVQGNLPCTVMELNRTVLELRTELKKMSGEKGVEFIDLYDRFTDKDGLLDRSLTYDGIHLNGKGYMVWKKALSGYF